jgi:hypothetical protein
MTRPDQATHGTPSEQAGSGLVTDPGQPGLVTLVTPPKGDLGSDQANRSDRENEDRASYGRAHAPRYVRSCVMGWLRNPRHSGPFSWKG